MKRFPAAGPVESVPADLLGPFEKTAPKNSSILVEADRLTTLMKCILLWNDTAATSTVTFWNYWGYAYGVRRYVLTKSEKRFAAKFFDCVRGTLGSSPYLTTAHHLRTSTHFQRLDRATVQQVLNYVADHPTSCDQYLKPLAYSYKMQAHRSLVTAPFELLLTRHSLSTTLRGTSKRPGTLALNERLTSVQYKRATIQRLRCGLHMAGQDQTAVQKKGERIFRQKRPTLEKIPAW